MSDPEIDNSNKDDTLESTDIEDRRQKKVIRQIQQSSSNNNMSEAPPNPESITKRSIKVTRFQCIIFIGFAFMLFGLQQSYPPIKYAVYVVVPFVCAISFLVHLILFCRGNPLHDSLLTPLLVFTFFAIEALLVLFFFSFTTHDPFIAFVLITSTAWKSYYYVRKRFCPTDYVYNQMTRRHEEHPRQKLMGSPLSLFSLQIGFLWAIHYLNYSHKRQDIFFFGLSSQVLVLLHWAYLSKIGRQFKVHSVLAYLYVLSEIFILTLFFNYNEWHLICILAIYQSIKTITVLEWFYNLDGSYSIFSSFNFLGRFLNSYAKETLAIIIIGMVCLIFQLLDLWSNYETLKYPFLVILIGQTGLLLLLRIAPQITKLNAPIRLILYFVFVLQESFLMTAYTQIAKFSVLTVSLVFVLFNWKNCYVIREHFKKPNFELENQNEVQTKRFRKQLTLFSALIMIAYLLVILTRGFDLHQLSSLSSYRAYYFLSSIGLCMYILFEMELVPAISQKVPFNIFAAISYMMAEVYIVWMFNDILHYLELYSNVKLITTLASIVYIVKNVSFNVVMRDDQADVVGNYSGAQYEEFDDDDDF